MDKNVLHTIEKNSTAQKKMLAILIDPDTPDTSLLTEIVKQVNLAKADFIFVGGSLLLKDHLDACIQTIKSLTDIPVVLFPGSANQVSPKADAILFLSLI